MKRDDYSLTSLTAMLDSLLRVNEPLVTLFANAAAFFYHEIGNLNWAGFYFLSGDRLHLGPFIGKTACTTIERGKGVCGASVNSQQTIVVPDVNAFPGHIACDAASQSEIVVPLILSSGRIIGVLDLDSAALDRFSLDDRETIEQLRDVIIAKLERMIGSNDPVFV